MASPIVPLFKAKVIAVDLSRYTCTLNPLSGNESDNITDVPIPFVGNSDGTGCFVGLKEGTLVIAGYTSSESSVSVAILSFLPNESLISQLSIPSDAPYDSIKYPSLSSGEVILRGSRGSELSLDDKGGLIIDTTFGTGISLKRYGVNTAGYFVFNDNIIYTNGGRTIWGSVKRRSSIKKIDSAGNLFADTDIHASSYVRGLFKGSRALDISTLGMKRNPALSEYHQVINEFTTDSMFSGFDDEYDRIMNNLKYSDSNDTYKRNRDALNALHMAEHELIEIIAGNVVDITGQVLDINYHPILFGTNGYQVPNDRILENIEEARRKSRRGIGYHFQLSTNALKTDKSTSSKSFSLDIDKEGSFNLHVPKTSFSGNISYPSDANFTKNNNQILSVPAAPSYREPIPVTLRDESGNVVYPKTSRMYRDTGVRFDNSDGQYFENTSGASNVRINTTKYHNMYSAAEMLIANTISEIYVPEVFTDSSGNVVELSNDKPFEVSEIPDSGYTRSAIKISPQKSAINSGGDVVVAGNFYSKSNPILSNSFKTNLVDGLPISEQESGKISAGGRSANINFDGSAEMSIGFDDADNKSLVLDTAGSIIAWLGKDKNGRSAIVQTDGDMLINIGGSYDKPSSNDDIPIMNKGRLDIRVNVVDKKHVGVESGTPDDRSDSDYIISISENGLVVAGMNRDKPMVFRNHGQILIESAGNDVVLKGTQVKIVEAGRSPRTAGKDPRARN